MSRRTSNPPPHDYRDDPAYWFTYLESACAYGDDDGVARAYSELLRLGVLVFFEPRNRYTRRTPS
jgi:hypothetical protein